MNYPKRDLKAPLIDKHLRFQELSEKLTHQLEKLSAYIDALEAYKAELAKREREKAARRKMRETAVKVNKLIVYISDIFKEIQVLKFSDPKDKENRKKTLKRLRGYFTRQHDRFVQSLNTFQEKEKIYIEERRSVLSGSSTNSVLSNPNQNQNQNQNQGQTQFQTQKYFESVSDPGIEVAMQDIDFYQALLQEREQHIQQFRGIAYEIKLMAEDQRKALLENQGDLENAVSAMSVAEKMVEDGQGVLEEHEKESKKKRFDSACKRNTAVCLLVVVICGIVLIATLTTGVIKIN